MIDVSTEVKWNGKDIVIKAKNWSVSSPYKAGLILLSHAASLCPVDEGLLRNSLSVRSIKQTKSIGQVTLGGLIDKPTEANVALIGTNIKYAPSIEFGSKPHMPPVEIIKRWVHNVLHLVYGSIENNKAAWGIALKIKKMGTKAQPFMRPALDATIVRMAKSMETEAKQEFREYFKEKA